MLFVVFCLALLAPSASAAQTDTVKDCDQQFLDLTVGHVLQGDGSMGPINAAMQELTSQGVDVRVRMVDNPPGGSVDAYEAAQVKSCPSWSLNGEIKPNLFVLLMTLEGHDGIFYGDHFGGTMESEVDSIRTSMHDSYAAGHYADAIVTGLHNSSEVIKGNDNPADGGWPAWVVWVLIGAGVLIVIGVISYLISRGSGGGYGGSSYGGSGRRSSGGSGYYGGGVYGASSCGGGGASCGAGGSSGSA
jgi:hypothetical protein